MPANPMAGGRQSLLGFALRKHALGIDTGAQESRSDATAKGAAVAGSIKKLEPLVPG
jgi:hypothetical protein